MRLLTFSVLKKCKLKLVCVPRIPRPLSTDAEHGPVEDDKLIGDPNLLEWSPAWQTPEVAEMRARMLRDMRVVPDFVSAHEESSLLDELEPVLSRMRYEYDHWDNAIHGYRETERGSWRAENGAVMRRVLEAAFPARAHAMRAQHVLDLAPGGHIKPHVDAVRFCGAVIAGLCLSSSAVMRLVHASRPELHVLALLPRRALYIMRDSARYDYTHAVLGNDESRWGGAPVHKLRRIAIITRSEPEPATAGADK